MMPAAGCSSPPAITHTGFISDYTTLKKVDSTRMTYVSPRLEEYGSFLVEPIQDQIGPSTLTAADRTEALGYARASLIRVLRERGYGVTDEPAPGIARVRIALTRVQDSTWWMKVHPASSLAGAGRGGVSMEGEVVDAVSGEQLGAVVQSGVGSQFTLGNYSTLSDVKSVIDEWAQDVGKRIDAYRSGKRVAEH